MKQNHSSIFSLLLFLTTCTPEISNRGFDFEIANVEKVKVGQTKEEVVSVLGTPSSTASFKDNAWYYISKKTSQTSFYDPKTQSQRVIAVFFDGQDRVSRIEDLDKSTAKEVKLSDSKTETTGYESGVMREVFGTFGRFAPDGKKKGKAS